MSIITLIKSYCDDIKFEMEARDNTISKLKDQIEELKDINFDLNDKIEDLEQQLAELDVPA